MASVLFDNKEITIEDNLTIEKVGKDDDNLILKLNGIQIGSIKGEVLTQNQLKGYWIHSVLIDKQFREKGYGKILIKALLETKEDIVVYGVNPIPYNVDFTEYEVWNDKLEKWYKSFSIDGKKIELMPFPDRINQRLYEIYSESKIRRISIFDRLKSKFYGKKYD